MVSTRRADHSHGVPFRASQQSPAAAQPIAHSHVDAESYQDSYYVAASLPAEFAITLAVQPEDLPLDELRTTEARVKGEEAIGDVWDRVIPVDGRLEVTWGEKGAKRLCVRPVVLGVQAEPTVEPAAKRERKDKPLWYTAGIHGSCICKLRA
jgi:hypothetical protein